MTDEHSVITQAMTGEKEAFSSLVRHYQNRVFGFIMRMTGNREVALDLTQDTFLAAYQNLSGFRRDASFSTWLFQIAVNKTRNYLKRAGRELPLPEGFEPPSRQPGPEGDYIAKEQQGRLLAALRSLPEKQRLTFTLRYFEQMKFDEIARAMGVSVSAAKTNFAEALKKLQKKLG